MITLNSSTTAASSAAFLRFIVLFRVRSRFIAIPPKKDLFFPPQLRRAGQAGCAPDSHPFLPPYQAAWVKDTARLKLAEKPRQVGWSWTRITPEG